MKRRLRSRDDKPGARINRARHEGEAPITRALVTGLTVRQDDEDENVGVIGGYGLKWDDVYDAGWMTESFRKGAFLDSLDEVRLKIGHSYSTLALARSQKSMDLGEDDTGLAFEARLNLERGDAMDLYLAVRDGTVDGMSIGFWPLEEVVTHREDEPTHYEVTKADLIEISAVDFPAYESSEVEPRTRERAPDGLAITPDHDIMYERELMELLRRKETGP